MAAVFTSPSYLQLEGLSTSGSMLALSASQLGGNEWGGELRLFDGRTKANAFKTLGAARLPCGSSSNQAFNEGGNVCCAGDDGNVYLFKTPGADDESITQLRVMAEHDDLVSSVHVNEAGSAVASGSWDATVKLWDIESGKCLQTIDLEDHVVSVRFLTDTVIAAAERDGSISVWDARQDHELTARKKLPVSACVMINQSRKHLLIGCEDGSVVEWTPYPEYYQNVRQHHAAVHALAVCPDTERLLSGSDDGRVNSTAKTHEDFVRGATWFMGRPVTASWDGTMRYVDSAA